jgi:hypothetical protein
LAKCAAITQAGAACKGIPIDASSYCYAHHPDYTDERRRYGSKGGKRGGRGRPSAELSRLQERLEDLADKVLAGEVERGVGAVVGQLLNGARACVRDGSRRSKKPYGGERMTDGALEGTDKEGGTRGAG